MLVIMLRASVGNAAAGLAACVNMRDCIRVPVEMRAIAPLPPQHMASEANKHHSNRGFEGLRKYLGDGPTEHDRNACERKERQRMPESPGEAVLKGISDSGLARGNARDRRNMICLERVLHSREETQSQDRHGDHRVLPRLDRNVTS
jgi:hypothetical protein